MQEKKIEHELSMLGVGCVASCRIIDRKVSNLPFIRARPSSQSIKELRNGPFTAIFDVAARSQVIFTAIPGVNTGGDKISGFLSLIPARVFASPSSVSLIPAYGFEFPCLMS